MQLCLSQNLLCRTGWSLLGLKACITMPRSYLPLNFLQIVLFIFDILIFCDRNKHAIAYVHTPFILNYNIETNRLPCFWTGQLLICFTSTKFRLQLCRQLQKEGRPASRSGGGSLLICTDYTKGNCIYEPLMCWGQEGQAGGLWPCRQLGDKSHICLLRSLQSGPQKAHYLFAWCRKYIGLGAARIYLMLFCVFSIILVQKKVSSREFIRWHQSKLDKGIIGIIWRGWGQRQDYYMGYPFVLGQTTTGNWEMSDTVLWK